MQERPRRAAEPGQLDQGTRDGTDHSAPDRRQGDPGGDRGAQPDAALTARVKAFETKRQQGAQELANRGQQFQRNQAYVAQQIQSKLGPIYQQVMTRRGANIMVEIGTTLASGKQLDVTGDVLAALNAALPSVSTTAPAAPAQQQPQGR